MRRLFVALLALSAVILPLAPAPAQGAGMVFTVGSKTCTAGGRSLSMDVAPFIDPGSGRVYVPLRFLAQALGAAVAWDAKTGAVTMDFEENGGMGRDLVLELVIGNNTMTVINRPGNRGMQAQFITQKQVVMDAVPMIVRGRTMVPASWVARALGFSVTWHAADRSVDLTPPDAS